MSVSHFRKVVCIVVAGAAAGLAGCTHGPSAPPRSAATVAQPGAIEAIVQLLDAGNADAARKRVKTILKRDPMNAEAQLLRDSIERDPKDLLGPTSHPYLVRGGDTMLSIADRLLGNRLKFYQLARYNGIAVPARLTPGRTLAIPGEAPRPTPVRVEPRPSATHEPGPRARPDAAPRAAPAKPAAAPSATNPAAARVARGAGLAALNQGNLPRALTLLRRAAALDPGNPMIARDLQRAQRIAATVRARR